MTTSPLILPSDVEIRRILVDRIDTQRKSVGMVVGTVTPTGRRLVVYGELNQGDPRPLDGDTLFDIASVTKVFTSLLLADMAGRGEVALTDPVSKYLPPQVKLPERNGRSIRLVDLATHTSGLPTLPPDYPALNDPAIAEYSLERLYRFLAAHELPRDIGSQWEYSNIGMALLGDALTRRAGLDYETLVRTRISGPLGMAGTSSITAGMEPRLAVPHDGELQPVPRVRLGAFAPAGCLLSTGNDLLTLLEAFLGFRKSALAPAMSAMLEPRVPIRPPIGALIRQHWRMMLKMAFSRRRGRRGARQTPPGAQAMAWSVYGQGDNQIVVHDGAGFNCAASLAFDPNAHVGVVVLSNAGVMVQDIARHILRPGYPLTEARHEITLARAVLDRYAGDYRSPLGTWTVTREGDRLMIRMPRMGTMRLRPEDEQDFFTFEFDLQFAFQRDAHGQATHLLLRPSRLFPELSATRIDRAPGT